MESNPTEIYEINQESFTMNDKSVYDMNQESLLRPNKLKERVDILLGDIGIMMSWNCVLYVISSFGILLSYLIYDKELLDWDADYVFYSTIANGTALLFLLIFRFTYENKIVCLSMKILFYISLPIFTISQLKIIYQNMTNFVDLFECIVEAIDDGTELWTTRYYWLGVGVLCLVLMIAIVLFCGGIAAVFVTPVVVVMQFFILSLGFFFMLMFPFCFFFYQILCLFLFTPSLLAYDVYFIVKNLSRI